MNEDFLNKKLNERKEKNAFRSLRLAGNKIDFCSNDYLGIAKNNLIQPYLIPGLKHGSGGSRLLAGNYSLIEQTEQFIAGFHDAESGLIFNSGYDANIGLLSCVPQKGDIILYDNIIHASIRDGIRLSFAQGFSFFHNDLQNLEEKLAIKGNNVFVVTESFFSMDGDIAPLKEIADLCEKYNANLIVDEAHATGVIGNRGEGLVQYLQLQKKCFARVNTFGKACGVHGAIVLGSNKLRNYLINFARPFIYSTALPEISIAEIRASYQIFPSLLAERGHLNKLIQYFQEGVVFSPQYSSLKIPHSKTPIQLVIIPGNKEAKAMADKLQENNLDVRAILYPSVPKGSERLRIVLHSFNTFNEVDTLLHIPDG
ncbi:MAG: pyridoxal phosphate-dependent aminotransferase family protein [Ginsengibacter sp.]